MNDSRMDGIIIAHYGIAVQVRTSDGETRRIQVKRYSEHVVGDRITVRGEEIRNLERTTVLRRLDARGNIRVVAANLDVLGIVTAPIPLSPHTFIDRAVVTARASGFRPFLIVNKSDLERADVLHREYESIYGGQTPVFRLSAATGEGLEALRRFFSEGHRGAFVGTTGVGKSSLLNALCPRTDLAVGELNQVSGRGRHTTTVSTLHTVPSGGELIDTPGFRDFGLAEIPAADLGSLFPGFEPFLEAGCRFRNCLHRKEPECAVTGAIRSGALPVSRYESYLKILAELEDREGRISRRRE